MIHAFLLHNDEIVDAAQPRLLPGQIGALSGWGVFSTIRVFDGVLFAFERHLARMRRDAGMFRVPFPDDAAHLHQLLLRLVAANDARNASLRVAVLRNTGGIWQSEAVTRAFDLVAMTAPVKEWGQSVKLGVMEQARHSASPFAGGKSLSWCHNLVWYEEAHERGCDELVLLNERGEVSECTSANLFAAYGDTVCTPPLESGCLAGVTREIILSELRVPGVTMEERTLTLADLEAADEVFITSTTRNLLPVVAIDGLNVRTVAGPRVKLDGALNAYIDAYVAAHR